MNAASYIIFTYIGIFVNLYIWEDGHRIADVAWFNLVLFAVWGFSFASGAVLLTRFSIRLLIAISAMSAGTAFLLLSYLELSNRWVWIACIAIPVGIMWGMYAVAQNMSVSLSGHGPEFGNFFAIQGIIAQTLNMTVPIASALAIQIFGYAGSFALMLLFVAMLFTVSHYLPRISLRQFILAEPIRWRDHLPNRVFAHPGLRWMGAVCLTAGLFFQFQGLFALLFTFSITDNKMWIALLNSCYTLSVIVALIIYRKVKLQGRVWLVVGIVLIASGFLLVLRPLAPLLVLSNILTTVGLFYFNVNWNSQQFEWFQPFTAIQRATIFVWREISICITRVVLLFLVLPVTDFSGPIFLLLLTVALASLFLVPFLQSRMLRSPAVPMHRDDLESQSGDAHRPTGKQTDGVQQSL